MVPEFSAARLELHLRTLRDVLDCALVPLGEDAPGAAPGLHVAYVVPAAQAPFAALRRRVAAAALDAGLTVRPVLVDGIPRLDDGTVDRAALDDVPVLDESLLRDHRRAHPGAADLRLEPAPAEAGRLHLAGLDPQPPSATDASGPGTQPLDTAPDATGTEAAPGDTAPPAVSAGPDLTPDPDAPCTLPEALLRTAAEYPERGLHLVLERDRTVFLSYPELLRRARHILGGLRDAGLGPGSRAILQLPSLDQYFPALWACLLGGIRPVTVARPPGWDAPGAVLDKLHHAWQTLREPVIIAGGEAVTGVRTMAGLYPMEGVRVLDVERLEQAQPATAEHVPDPGETAMLQLSSGSTGRSKAIRITHRGIMEYVAGARAQDTGPDDTTVNWLPLDHVAGLLMFHLRDTVLGCTAVHTPTDLVVADPLLWLDLLERYRAAHTWSPNFGYKLVVEALRADPGRHWDLSSVRSLINAGEQCTLPVVSDFLAATAPFGMPEDAMLLAWGMAETCTAISYKRFGTPGTVHRVRKSSLTGALEWVGDEVPEAERTTFLSMGPPTLGATFRICDDDDRVLPEGRIGRLQVHGGRVTPGYLDNPEANAEAFRGDGWFDTGDLAFLHDGELTITGRRKEVIIINGSHYFCHELEDAVGSIGGVTAGSVAACGVPAPGTGSEQLVVFFVPDPSDAPTEGVAQAVRRIRGELARRFQLTGASVVPVAAGEFPKTTSGKIQRTGIRRRFLDGAFDDVLRRLDLVEGNARTVPDAIHRAVWEPVPAGGRTAPPVDPQSTLVVADRAGLAAQLIDGGAEFASSVIVIPGAPGTAYARTAPGRWTLDPADRAHWDTLWADLRDEGRAVTTLLHLAGYAAPAPLDVAPSEREALLADAGAALILAVQARRAACGDGPFRVIGVTRGLHRITGDEPVGYTGALTGAVTAVLALEWAAADVRHLDLAGTSCTRDAEDLTAALAVLPAPRPTDPYPTETAVRGGTLHRRRLTKVALRPADGADTGPLFTHGSCVVVTGGLGGVGREILAGLLRRFRLRLLILGRTPLPDDTVGPVTDASAAVARTLADLAALGGDVRYRAVDVTDAEACAAAVADTEGHWGRPLDAVLHLAGAYRPTLLEREDAGSWRRSLDAKAVAALHLADLVRRRPGARFVSFSSLLTVTPSAESGSYVAANRFLESLHQHLDALGVPGHCIVWGLWSGVGINRDNPYEEVAVRRGMRALTPAEGRRLARVVLAQPPGSYVVGLDDTSPALRGLLRPERPSALERPVAGAGPADAPQVPPLVDLRGREVPVAVLPQQEGERPEPSAPQPATAPAGAGTGDRARIREAVLGALTEAVGESVDERRPFYEIGLTSIQLMRVHGAIERALGRSVPQTLLFQHPTAARLVDALAGSHATASRRTTAAPAAGPDTDRRIAVIGMAGRFPGAPDLDAYWRLISSGEPGVRRFSPEELAAAGVTDQQRSRPDHVPVGGALEGADLFDASFFNISAREAEVMEPQQRLLLEVCHHALEDGGYPQVPEDTPVAVFASTGMTLHALQTYLLNNLVPTEDLDDPVTALQVAIGNQADFAATRVAYRLGLHGPAVGVQTACSSSLVSVHLAAQALLSGDAEIALAGAAAVHVPQHTGYHYVPGSILSRTGACRAFDAAADGTLGGNGVAAVLLKRYDRAIADGDTVHAVILGSAVNNDGAGKVGFTAPSVTGQRQVIARALRAAGVDADTIGYVEAHGTGTELGDPIEFQALTQAFRETSDRRTYCALGSVKPTIGHLDSAAGMAGLIKAVLALRHRQIPPLAGFERPNPAMDVEDSPFYLTAAGRPWERDAHPRRAGVSALGVGGTNAHVVLEEAPEPAGTPRPASAAADGPGLLPLSARTPAALAELASAHRELLRGPEAPRPADAFATAALRRASYEERLVVLGRTADELARSLDDFLAAPASAPVPSRAGWIRGTVPGTPQDGPLVMLCAGQGTQRRGMARELYHRFPAFRAVIDECEQHFRDAWDGSLTEVLLDGDPADGRARESWTTDLTQPALFAFEVALVRLWESLGVRPDCVAGHSVGEYAAFCAAGALSVADGLHLTAARGRLMQQRCAPGAMAAVLAGREIAEKAATGLDGVELAVINGVSNHVLAGPPEQVAEAVRRLEADGHSVRLLPGDRAFHSRLVEPILDDLRAHAAQLRLEPLRIPLISNLGGEVLPTGHVPDVDYVVRQTRETADYAAVLSRLADLGTALHLEIGPDATLTSLGRRARPDVEWTASQPRSEPGTNGLLRAVAGLHCRGVGLEWSALALKDDPGRPARLPLYPFHRTSHWISAGTPTPPAGGPAMPNEAPAPAPSDAPTGTAPAPDLLVERILQQVREQAADQLSLTVEDVAPEVAFFDLGADSLLMINMIRRLEKAFGVRIAMRELFEDADTPQRLSELVAERMPADRAAELRGAEAEESAAACGAEPAAEPPAAGTPAPAVPEPVAPPAAVPVAAPAPPAGEGSAPPADPAQAPVQAVPAEPAAALPALPAAPSAAPVAVSEAGRLVDRQLQLMSNFSQLMGQQLALLGGQAPLPSPQPAPTGAHPPLAAQPAPAAEQNAPAPQAAAGTEPAPATAPPAATPLPAGTPAAPAPALHGPRVAVPRGSGMASGRLTDEQRAHLDDLTRRLTARTATSKAITQRHRKVLADSRAVVGFRSATKEMQYPLAARAARGAHLEDVDGNRYVDITMGFGVLLFGHEPEFVNDAVNRYLSGGIRLGPRSEETGRAAELLADITGFERVAFANSGTEANSAALRLARAATGRDTVVMFSGSYHGHADNVLGRGVVEDGRRETVPVSTGIPAAAVQDLVVLEYGAEESLAAIEEIAGRVAAVVVEPVQSRHPGLQPREFLHALRRLTQRHGIVLFFDEMLTGFRPHLEGARGVFGVTPDLATYGKVLGGGYPIGAIAGRSDIMDGIDGGHWSYGDDSYPPRDTTFFGGTYIQHPVAMVAAEAVLGHLKQQGPALQEKLNATTERLVGTLNRFFEDEEFPVRIARFGSLFRFEYRGNLELFFHHLLLRGVYVWEWRNFFLSTAHTEQDIEFLVHAVRNALYDMRRGGFLPAPGGKRPVPAYAAPLDVPCGPGPLTRPAPAPAAPSPAAAPAAPTPAAPAARLPAPRTPAAAPAVGEMPPRRAGSPDFSLYFFGDYPRESDSDDKYRIILESSRFGDEHGFHAVWLPERHFHSFGGVFPNPSVLGAAIARETARIRINAGCVVLPLHHPVRVAEEWSVIDNLSGGRVGIGCASGWHPNDFVFQPANYGRHKEVMYEHLRTVQKLWRGEEVPGRNGHGDDVAVRLFPRPVQEMPPFYTAIVGNPDSYREAARNDIGVITNLMTQSVEDLARNVALYRSERAAAGLDPAAGRVVVLLHSYLGDDAERVRAEALPAFSRYMRSSLSLFGQVSNSLGIEIDYANTPEEDLEFLLERAFDRYCRERALIGTPDGVGDILDRVLAAGADEIAFFVDFGVTPDQARSSLPYLDELRRRYQDPAAGAGDEPAGASPQTAPLSYAQQRIWFLDRLHPGRTTYNECSAVRLDGPLDTDALGTALRRAVERHPALRTVFREHDGEPVQIALDAPHAGPELLDCTGEDEDAALRRVVDEENTRPFDLEHGPLLRTRLLRLSPERHVLVLTAHHIVFDSVSAQVLTRELSELYAAAVEQRPDRLPAPPAGALDFARRERESVDSEEGRRSLAHWLKQLEGAPSHLELPADRPRPAVPSGRGACVHRHLDAELARSVRTFGRSRRATPFMVVLTAFCAAMQRLTGRDDLVIGTPVANRPAGTEDLVGFFVNTLALRTDLGGDPSFRDALDRVRATAFDAYEHQELPFEKLVRELNPERDPARSPVVQVCIEYETEPVLELDLPGVRARALDIPTRKAPFDFTLFLTDLDDGLHCRAEYSTDLFDEETARGFVEMFAACLAAGVAAPELPLSRLTAPDDMAWTRELRAATAAPYAGEHRGTQAGEPLHHRIARHVAQRPDATAVTGGGVRLTYRDLDAHAAALAARLREHGVTPGSRVAVLLPRGPQWAVAVLAAVRAGAVYVPLDPAHPADRLAWTIEDSGTRLLLTGAEPAPGVAADGVTTLAVDLNMPPAAHAGSAEPDGHDLLCVLYTSGSTGRPKGVAIRHSAMANVADWHTREFATGPDDRAGWAAGPAFDACSFELWAHLAAGASVHAVPDELRTTPEALRDWFASEGITSTFATTPLAELLLDLDWPTGHPLRLLVTGGQQLRRWRPAGAPFRLVNIYGPTENTVLSTWAEVPESRPGLPPIGRPVPGTGALVLDENLRPVPAGVPGELYVTGAHLADGYAGDPELTRERFVTDPSGRIPGRLYRTGDRARRRADGLLEFAGRIDRQVKIRGHRIEPGEIEHALLRLPRVEQAAVLARTDGPDGEPFLAGYIVLTGPVPADAAARQTARDRLTEALAAWLPPYMVPRAWVFLAALPVTANGKTDVDALPRPDLAADAAAGAPVRTELEQHLHALWAAELGLDAVPADRSFFELGGHSLTVVRLLNRVRAELGADIPVLDFFRAPTIRATAARIEQDRGTGGEDAPPAPPAAPDAPRPADRVRGTL